MVGQRCGAEKPACTTCARLGKDCVYETSKSTGRIAKLKNRIAELEEQVEATKQTLGVLTRSSSSTDLSPGIESATTDPSFLQSLTAEAQQSVSLTSVQGRNTETTYEPNSTARPLESPGSTFAFNFETLDPTVVNLMTDDSMFQTILQAPSNKSRSSIPQLTESGTVRDVVGGWFDPEDVPIPVRDLLLDIYFSEAAILGFMFHMPKFYARLTLPPAKRPHPALLYSMYLVGAKRSSQPGLRQLETRFMHIADRHLKAGLDEGDRPLDIVRASVLMIIHLYTSEKYSLGFALTGATVKLAQACGLHRIQTSVWAPPPPQAHPIVHFTMRAGGYLLGPPEDQLDLAERIYTFWTVYEVDQCTAVASLFEPTFRSDDIITPLPRAFDFYVLGLVSRTDDVTMHQALDIESMETSIDDIFLVHRLKIETLLGRIVRVKHLLPEVPVGAGSYGRAMYLSHPTAFTSLKHSLDLYCDRLPPAFRLPWRRWDEGAENTLPRMSLPDGTAILWFLIGNAYLLLWNVRSLNSENAMAVIVARRIVSIMCLFPRREMRGAYDAFIMTIWNEVAMILLREYKRLTFEGRSLGMYRTRLGLQ
ncbi:hypothetical protein BCR39DRAFT_537261 [Naematelia encephala]|uniref:Transcription factor domain-containing protein n=1 Tax=Naematelia encephala TaxID=71784 RepID=A0A1Y2B139_9TREE|nr:hypothetical protein BCR39DRAFT_537261 [Naematelia encephala]